MAWNGIKRIGMAWKVKEIKDMAWNGMERNGKAWQVKARTKFQ
jgi:hypothetical protein